MDKYKEIYSKCMSDSIMKNRTPCPGCNKPIVLGRFGHVVEFYPEILYECGCGVVVNEKGEDKTKDYYK